MQLFTSSSIRLASDTILSVQIKCHFKSIKFESITSLMPPVTFTTDSTKITLAPSNADVKVGENAWMQCAASHDLSLDITFIWSVDGQVIDLHKESRHYERTPVRRFPDCTLLGPVWTLSMFKSNLRLS